MIFESPCYPELKNIDLRIIFSEEFVKISKGRIKFDLQKQSELKFNFWNKYGFDF